MKLYTKKDYGWHKQNWDVAQDLRGVMYFANVNGVLEYDGKNWKLISLPNETVVRTLAVDDSGRVYVGSAREFGYLAPDKSGEMLYHSLSVELDSMYLDFKSVWFCFATPEGILFSTDKYVIKYNPTAHNLNSKDSIFTVWKADNKFIKAEYVNNRFYVYDLGKGLRHLIGDSLNYVPGTDKIKGQNILSIMPYSKNQILLGMVAGGLWLLDTDNSSSGNKVKKLDTELNSFFTKNGIYNGSQLSNGNYVFATKNGGALITTPGIKPVQLINKCAEMKSNRVFCAKEFDGVLWLCTNNGIVKIETDSETNIWDKDLFEPAETVNDIIRYKGRLYIVHRMVFTIWTL